MLVSSYHLPVVAVAHVASVEVDVHAGGGEILPTELDHISKREAREGCRLSCQVAIKQDMDIELEEEDLWC